MAEENEGKNPEELLKRWKEALDEMAGTEYDCSFDCGVHRGEEGYCYHGEARKREDERAAKILGELLCASPERDRMLEAAEKECSNPERQGWGKQRGLALIEKFRRM